MEDKIFLLVEVSVQTTHQNVDTAISELQQFTDVEVMSTKNVRVRRSQIIKIDTRKGLKI
jgi:hypothetical protein